MPRKRNKKIRFYNIKKNWNLDLFSVEENHGMLWRNPNHPLIPQAHVPCLLQAGHCPSAGGSQLLGAEGSSGGWPGGSRRDSRSQWELTSLLNYNNNYSFCILFYILESTFAHRTLLVLVTALGVGCREYSRCWGLFHITSLPRVTRLAGHPRLSWLLGDFAGRVFFPCPWVLHSFLSAYPLNVSVPEGTVSCFPLLRFLRYNDLLYSKLTCSRIGAE